MKTYNYCANCRRYVIDARKARKGSTCPNCGAVCVDYQDEQLRQRDHVDRLLEIRRRELGLSQ
jgi:hypothetical protein